MDKDYLDHMTKAFQDELSKIAMKRKTAKVGKGLAILGAGTALGVGGVRAEQDRRLGRQLRRQQRR